MKPVMPARRLFLAGVGAFGIVVMAELFVPHASVCGDTRRGEDPHCQEACLHHHSEKMSLLSREYSRTTNKQWYQDQVEDEVRNYSRCLTNCREVLPIK